MSFAIPLVALLAATPGRLAITDIDAPDMMLGLAGQVTRSLVAEAKNQGLVFVPPEELRSTLLPKRLEELRKCGGQPACVAQVLDGAGFSRAVVGTLGRDEKNYLLKLWLVDLETLKIVAGVDRAILIAARRLQKDLDEAIPRLLRGEQEAKGTLVVESNITDAQVSVNGEPVGTPPATLSLKPGKYEVRLERKKYLPVTRLIGVEAGKETKERVVLLLKPGEVADEPLASVTHNGSAPGALRIGVPAWIALGAAVVAGGVGLYFGLTEQRLERSLRDGLDATTGVYAGTRRQALDAQLSALGADISFAVAGAALITSVVLIILDSTSAPAVSVAPAVNASSLGLTLGGPL
jgi:hypothetical protein